MPKATSRTTAAFSARPAGRRRAPTSTAARALDAAERLAQTRGFNGFSYADIANDVGITKASLHYHFSSKEVLGCALVERYRKNFGAALAAITAQGGGATAQLKRYARLYEGVLSEDRMCLCGMLAAEYETLPATMQQAVRAFFDANETWLTGVLAAGRDADDLRFPGSPREAARYWISALEGAMLLARSYGEPARLSETVKRLLSG